MTNNNFHSPSRCSSSHQLRLEASRGELSQTRCALNPAATTEGMSFNSTSLETIRELASLASAAAPRRPQIFSQRQPAVQHVEQLV